MRRPGLGASSLSRVGRCWIGLVWRKKGSPTCLRLNHCWRLPTQKSAMTSTSPTLPSKADCFRSSPTDKGYKAMATTVRALNASSLLLAYQAELEVVMSTSATLAL